MRIDAGPPRGESTQPIEMQTAAIMAGMTATQLEFVLYEETLVLFAERALFWPRRQTLVIADPHFGKAATFRAGGLPVPETTTATMLERLTALLARTRAERLLCLGDLLHARSGRSETTLAAVATWRQSHAQMAFQLVRGNHDAHAGDPPADWAITCVDEPAVEGPFAWRHHPAPHEGAYAIAGHLHPAVRLNGAGRQSTTLPCFYFGAHSGVLPAFGEFTGTALVRPAAGERVFVLVGQSIVEKSVV